MYCTSRRVLSKNPALCFAIPYSYFSAINSSYNEKNLGKLGFGVWPERNFLSVFS